MADRASSAQQSHIVVTGSEAGRAAVAAALSRCAAWDVHVSSCAPEEATSRLGGRSFDVLVLADAGCTEQLGAALAEAHPAAYVIAPRCAGEFGVFDTFLEGHIGELILSIARAYRHHVFTARVKRLSSALERQAACAAARWQRPESAHAARGSEAMRRILRYLASVSQFGLPLILLGEPGSGRSELAYTAHRMRCAEAPFVPLRVSGMDARRLDRALDRAVAEAAGDGRRRCGTVFVRGLEDLDAAALMLLERRLLTLWTAPFAAEGARGAAPVCTLTVDAEWAATLPEDSPQARLLSRYEDLVVRVPPLRERPRDVPVIARRMAARLCRELGLPQSLAGSAARGMRDEAVYAGNRYTLQAQLMRRLAKLKQESLVGRLRAGSGSP